MQFIKIILVLTFLSTIILPAGGQAQNISTAEQKMIMLFEKLRFEKTDSKKDSLNTIILKEFENILQQEASFEYPFNHLRSVGTLLSEDRLLKIYTWNIFYRDGSNRYFGFVQYRKKKRKAHELYRLTDQSHALEKPKQKKLSPDNWYGCLYYDLVQKKINRRNTIYTLMGWDAHDNFSNKKIIDILHIDRRGLNFGLPVINYQNHNYNRLIFEYAEQSKMLLQYDKRYDMIIWDHLSAPNSGLKGNYEYYGPDGTQDGLNFENGMWKYYPDIKPKNQK